jgi:hypothetical protein
MRSTLHDEKWTVHRAPHPRTGKSEITYRSLDVIGTGCYLTVDRSDRDYRGDRAGSAWGWAIYDKRRQNAFGAALRVEHGEEPTQAKAKAAAIAAIEAWGSTRS